MILKQANGVTFFQFENLAQLPQVRHAVFTRQNGRSQGPYRSLNVSYGVGDDRRDVLQNRRIVSNCLGAEEVIFVDQVHGTRVAAYTDAGGFATEEILPEDMDTEVWIGPQNGVECDRGRQMTADALVTDAPNRFLGIQVADCQSILMVDPLRYVVANVHAGWRGTIKNVIGRTVQVMQQRFGVLPADIIAGIGPSLGPCCAEFVNYQQEIPEAFWGYKDDRQHFDLWSLSCDQLCDTGVLAGNIELSRLCTKCGTDHFFSYRGEGVTGRFAAVIGMSGRKI